MADRLDEVMAAAVARGLLPDTATRPPTDQRPWPVVLLTALGAWLAAIPMLGVVALLLGPLMDNGIGPYLAGLLVLGGSAVLLRGGTVPFFVEQLAVPGLLVGGGSLAFGFFRDLPEALASLLLAAIALGHALWVRPAWLRVLLGVLVAGLVGLALLTPKLMLRPGSLDELWVAAHLLLLIGLASPATQPAWTRRGAVLESVSAGWWLVTLAGLAWLSGMTFLVGGVMGGEIAGEIVREVAGAPGRRSPVVALWPTLSALMALGGAAWLARCWPVLRQPMPAVVALVLAGLAWWMPPLGAVLLGLAALAAAKRWRLVVVAGVAAAWIVGAFYYALAWPLATKAVVLAGAGAVLGVLAAWGWTLAGGRVPRAVPAGVAFDRRALWLGLGTLATVAVAAGAIWQKQDLIANGRPVFVQLAPVDPRSLMQGDYMRLNFLVPGEVLREWPDKTAERPKVVARRDERNVATLVRPARAGEPLAAGEFLFELTPKNGDWILVTDAWFFREGEAERWAAAKFGEFRVLPDGRALLVGMADEQLRPIPP
jgi:uncharacterized membrane-anchored protein